MRWGCHEVIGVFSDYHLTPRSNEAFAPVCDVFYKFEDMHYNQLLAALLAGVCVAVATVEYVRYPGNSYDRQYEKFRRPFGHWDDDVLADECFRLALGDVIAQHHLKWLCATEVGRI